jgi:hypothetical protein
MDYGHFGCVLFLLLFFGFQFFSPSNRTKKPVNRRLAWTILGLGIALGIGLLITGAVLPSFFTPTETVRHRLTPSERTLPAQTAATKVD